MFDFVRRRYTFFMISLAIIIPGLIALAIPPHLKLGIDFSAGATVNVRFEQTVDQAALRQALADLGQSESIVQRTGDDNSYMIRTKTLREDEKDADGNVTKPGERQEIVDGLAKRFGPVEVLSFDSVSPLVATETVRNATLAVLVACIGIILYIAYAFRHVPHPMRWGICTLIALLHDVLVVIGLYAILGHIFNLEVDAMFITALLTVVGFSVHDTIVVFDRIRENLRRGYGGFASTVNHSVMQTLGRSLTTSLTTILALIVLYLFGGSTIRNFVLVLLIGITSGTFSSIFNASQLLAAWELGDFARWFKRDATAPKSSGLATTRS